MELDPLIVKLILDSTGYQSNLTSANTSTGTTGAAMKSVFSGVGLGGVLAFASVAGAITGTVAVLKECYNVTMDYLDEVKKMSLLNGITIEDTARLIAVTGRYDVTVQDLNTASRTLAKQGLSLTVDTLKDMATQFSRLTSADEREAFLMANFGARGGTAFVELMNAGADAIGAEADAVNEGLIPNQAMLDMQNNQKDAVYNMSLAWKTFQLQIGEEILPALTELLEGLIPVVAELNHVVDLISFVLKWGTAAGLGATTHNAIEGLMSGANPNSLSRSEITGIPGYASGTGGWLTVPSGFPDDSYRVGMTSGEQYAVTKPGASSAGIDYRKLAHAIRDALNG